MRICPVCGYRDVPIWRNIKWRYFTEHCHIEELEVWDKKLADTLREKRYVCLNGIKYRLTKNGLYVHRIPAFLCRHPNEANPSIEEPQTEKPQWKPLSHKLDHFFDRAT